MEAEELIKMWKELSELEWKDCYNMFRKEVNKLDIIIPIPEFTADEEALLDMIYETDSYLKNLLKSFYSGLYELIVLLEKGYDISYKLIKIGDNCGRIRERLMDLIFREGRRDLKEIIDSIIEKMSTTLLHISMLCKTVKQKGRSRR